VTEREKEGGREREKEGEREGERGRERGRKREGEREAYFLCLQGCAHPLHRSEREIRREVEG
jgi:hypothetical protein